MSYFLQKDVDWDRHNEEAARVWAAYRQGKPERVPVSVTGSIRVYFQNPELNTNQWTFRDYFEDPDIQIAAQVEFQKWQRFNVLDDSEMGWPQAGWNVGVDFQNCYDAAWLGCPILYTSGQVPDTPTILSERKEALYDWPESPDESRGLLPRAKEFLEYMNDSCQRREYYGLPLIPRASTPLESTDGPLSLAYKLRGADNVLIDMLTDETYFHDLMHYLTENLIRRIKRMKEYRWKLFPDSPDAGQYKRISYGFADDAIALISLEQYKEFVYPYHKRFYDEFNTGAAACIHLCGDATRHFPFIRDALQVTSFDTGFPVDHGALRKALGPAVTIYGGPTIMEVKDGSVSSIETSVRQICGSGVMEGGRFVMIAANNLAPLTPVENIQALYEATKKYGRYLKY